jgi:hypothetical protein
LKQDQRARENDEGEIAQRFCTAPTSRDSKDLLQKFGSPKSTDPSDKRPQ